MTNQPVTPLTAEAGPRCTCTPPDGVTQNHDNYCPLFKVRAAYAQGWADATLDAARTPSQPDRFCPLCDGSGVGPRGNRCECHCHAARTPSQPDLREAAAGLLAAEDEARLVGGYARPSGDVIERLRAALASQPAPADPKAAE